MPLDSQLRAAQTYLVRIFKSATVIGWLQAPRPANAISVDQLTRVEAQ